MLITISQGDILRCLHCGKAIKISQETLKIDAVREYIICPNCRYAYDTHAYHNHGKHYKDGDTYEWLQSEVPK